MTMGVLSFEHFALVALVSIVTAQTCYYPDHSTTSVDIPCNTTAEFSSCCGAGALCLASGLCYIDGVISRGSCSDKSWADASCATACQDDNADGGMALTSCGSGTDHKYACGFNTVCTDSNWFTLDNMTDLILRPSQVSAAVVALGTAFHNPTTSSNSSIPSPSPSPSPSESPSAKPADSTGYSAGAMAGVGVGVGLPLLLALAVALFLLRNEKKKNLLYAANAQRVTGTRYNGQTGMQDAQRGSSTVQGMYPKVMAQESRFERTHGPVPMELEANLPAASEVEAKQTHEK
ncbi:hypothetical protein EJ05DRAFT_535187 [Pseudovirgaria hyperparasitica]|uniref:Mid2 domain-containing protein n=1 Tax=Pseudovirgaria hyperparasitica TaxID=470096 RepID=A0A6A6WIF7_9PEZI|nr:uncharacterized protein EJ05DRAFT_535187 [Pseudovirgaria hyperparasitica]KAF2761860.1 hypothetical protein EJ05DRAFT_535187 [Pseudovirgaria hyperparasitica]